MKTQIETDDYTIYLTGIESGPESLTRHEREQMAAADLIHTAFGPEAKKSHYPDGAPFITGYTDIPVSLSHSTSSCLLAVGKNSQVIGADIESPRPQLRRVCSRFLNSAEQLRLTEEDNTASAAMNFLLKCWTAKEAVYKAARTPGLGLTEISISQDFTRANARGQWYDLAFHDAPATEEIICVAIAAGQFIS